MTEPPDPTLLLDADSGDHFNLYFVVPVTRSTPYPDDLDSDEEEEEEIDEAIESKIVVLGSGLDGKGLRRMRSRCLTLAYPLSFLVSKKFISEGLLKRLKLSCTSDL